MAWKYEVCIDRNGFLVEPRIDEVLNCFEDETAALRAAQSLAMGLRGISVRRVPACNFCGGSFGPAPSSEVVSTWQQWQCPCCGSWNDLPHAQATA